MSFASKFKGSNGGLLYKPLFLEMASNSDVVGRTKVLYTLKDTDYKGYPSLKRLYMEESDITEYSFAMKYFNDLSHWEKLCDMYWFKNHIADWRRQLELKIRSQALKALVALTENPSVADSNPSKVSINKFLAEGGWRSTREEKRKNFKNTKRVEEELSNNKSSVSDQVSSDFDRIISKDLN